MGSVIIAKTSGTTGKPKTININQKAITARCKVLEPYMKEVGQAVACNFNKQTSIKSITATKAVEYVGGIVQDWPGNKDTTLLVAGYSPLLEILQNSGNIWTNLKEVWIPRLYLPKVVSQIKQHLKVPIRRYYGTTETGCIAIDGVFLSGIEFDIRNDILWIKSDTIAKSCMNEDGWYQTQDKVTLDSNNHIIAIKRI